MTVRHTQGMERFIGNLVNEVQARSGQRQEQSRARCTALKALEAAGPLLEQTRRRLGDKAPNCTVGKSLEEDPQKQDVLVEQPSSSTALAAHWLPRQQFDELPQEIQDYTKRSGKARRQRLARQRGRKASKATQQPGKGAQGKGAQEASDSCEEASPSGLPLLYTGGAEDVKEDIDPDDI